MPLHADGAARPFGWEDTGLGIFVRTLAPVAIARQALQTITLTTTEFEVDELADRSTTNRAVPRAFLTTASCTDPEDTGNDGTHALSGGTDTGHFDVTGSSDAWTFTVNAAGISTEPHPVSANLAAGTYKICLDHDGPQSTRGWRDTGLTVLLQTDVTDAAPSPISTVQVGGGSTQTLTLTSATPSDMRPRSTSPRSTA